MRTIGVMQLKLWNVAISCKIENIKLKIGSSPGGHLPLTLAQVRGA